jgi:hypothetical protein
MRPAGYSGTSASTTILRWPAVARNSHDLGQAQDR